MKKSFTFIITLLAASVLLSAVPKKTKKTASGKVVASTSWTAAFADLAGIDEIDVIAPANLRHPPEYEITVSDIQKVTNSQIFIYAGFERMMKTLGDNVGNAQMIKITCDNSIATVSEMASKIAAVTHTEKECQKRVNDYIKTIETAKSDLEKNGLKGARVYCNKNQIYLAKDLGFEVVATFGPAPVTSAQIAFAKENDFDFIIDNVHNPVASPLAEVNPKAKVLVWRNFPEKVEHNSLKKVVQANINMIK